MKSSLGITNFPAWIVDCKHAYNYSPFSGSLTLTIWLFSSSHKNQVCLLSLESGVTLWLTLSSRIQKKWANSDHTLKKPWHFSLSQKLIQPLCEQTWAELLKNERPWGVKPALPAKAILKQPAAANLAAHHRCAVKSSWDRRTGQLNMAQVIKLSNINDWCLNHKVWGHMLHSKSELIQEYMWLKRRAGTR